MLDARQPAPRRRRLSSPALIVLAMVVAVGGWSATRLPDTGGGASVLPVTPAAADRGDTDRGAEYTQTPQRVAIAASIAGYPGAAVGAPSATARAAPPRLEWQSYDVRRGDTLGGIFKRFSVDVALAGEIADHETGAALKRLMPGHEMRLGSNGSGELVELRYQLDRMNALRVRVDGTEVVSAARREIPTETRQRRVSQAIGSSLFLSASQAGLSDRLIMDLVAIYGWQIDFARDLQPGDHFSLLFEEMFRDGEPVGTGDIVAARFVTGGEVFHAVRHVDDEGRKRYFDLEGNNLRGAFLRTPMRVSRITSGFSKRRYHPVLKKWRAHRGVDYGARTGTPVLATADGEVKSAGRKGGYGNTIVLQHGGRYSTLYAHLSRFEQGIERGARVHQGEVIGYAGATGLVTGPHLHYEFRVDGTHRNPLTYDMPKGEPIAERYRKSFLATAHERINRLNNARPERLASR